MIRTICTLLLLGNSAFAQTTVAKFDSINRVLEVDFGGACSFNSGFALTFTDDYDYTISDNVLYFVSMNRLYWNKLYEYEMWIEVHSCFLDSVLLSENFKLESTNETTYSLKETTLEIHKGQTIFSINLIGVTSEMLIGSVVVLE